MQEPGVPRPQPSMAVVWQWGQQPEELNGVQSHTGEHLGRNDAAGMQDPKRIYRDKDAAGMQDSKRIYWDNDDVGMPDPKRISMRNDAAKVLDARRISWGE